MKRLNSIETDQYSLEVLECACGFHLGVDASYLDQVSCDIKFACPACEEDFDCEVLDEDTIVRKSYAASDPVINTSLIDDEKIRPSKALLMAVNEMIRDSKVGQPPMTAEDYLNAPVYIDLAVNKNDATLPSLDEETYTSYEPLFRDLDAEECKSFRKSAMEVFKVGEEISSVWHPVYQDQCRKIQDEYDKLIKEGKRVAPTVHKYEITETLKYIVEAESEEDAERVMAQRRYEAGNRDDRASELLGQTTTRID
jgi:hypothetical protein